MALIIIAALYVKRFSFIWSPFSKGGSKQKMRSQQVALKMQLIDPAWSFIDATSSMGFYIQFIVVKSDATLFFTESILSSPFTFFISASHPAFVIF